MTQTQPIICRTMEEAFRHPALLKLTESHSNTVYLTDSNVAGLLPDSLHPLITIPAGEESKNLESTVGIWHSLIENKSTRRSLLINVGGGMIMDMGGFAAATFKRGINHANICTTLLGAVDAAIGGKTGIDFEGLKNEIGAFHHPKLVIIPLDSFDSLPLMEYLSGMGEILKYAFISDKISLGECIDLLEQRENPDLMEGVIRRCITIKERVVEEDPFDNGMRKILNFGHTAGHAFESFLLHTSGHLPHGVCVAHGILVELILSHRIYGLRSDIVHQYAQILKDFFPRLPFRCDDIKAITAFALHDKKNSDGKGISFVALKDLHQPETGAKVSVKDYEEALEIYHSLIP